MRSVCRLCPTLWDPMNCSQPGSSVQGMFQTRILEWVAIYYSRGSSWPRDQTHISWVSCIRRRILYQLHHLGSPLCANACILSHFGGVWLFVTLWTVVSQAPLSMGFSRQEYWSRLPCPSPGVLPDPGIQPASLNAPALACGFFTTKATWEATSVTKAQGTEEKQVSQCSSKLKMFLHQISYKESENQSTEREEKPLQIIFMIKLNWLELPGNILKLNLKLLGSIVKVNWWHLLFIMANISTINLLIILDCWCKIYSFIFPHSFWVCLDYHHFSSLLI